jgi:glycosyltransferase involved in cell wall biosynthesis
VHLITWTKHKGSEHFPFTVIRNPGIRELLREHRWADVVFENNPSLKLSWPNIFIRRPLVIALNTWIIRLSGNKGIRDKLKNLWFHRANEVIAVSDAIRKKEWKAAVVIENAYNNHLFKKLPGIQQTINFVFLGRLVSDKGADQAVRAISALIQEKLLDKKTVQLTIIGDGPEKQNLQQLLKDSGLENTVQLTGVLRGAELVNCLNHHRFILVPSSWEEPYGNVVLEAMACGCIPIASNGGGLPEAVGHAGLLFKRNDFDDMIRVIKDALQNPSKTELLLGNAEKHLAQHSLELVSKKYLEVLQQAVH